MPDQYAAAVRALIEAKLEQRAPEIAVVAEGKPETAVINIMEALKESMQAKGRAKIRDAVRKRTGKRPFEEGVRPASARGPSGARRTTH
jgi:non-homologous end joining protein Ku